MTDPTFTFSWEIRKFSLIVCEVCNEIKSDLFHVPILNDTSWKLLLYPRGLYKTKFLSLYLQREDDFGPETIHLSVTFKLFNRDGTIGKESGQPFAFSVFDKNGFSDFASLSGFDRYLYNDVLRIQCVLRKSRIDSTTMNVHAATRVDVLRVGQELTLPNFSRMKNGHHMKFSLHAYEDALDLSLNIVGRNGREDIEMRFSISDSKSTDELYYYKGSRFEPLIVIARITVLNANGSESDIWKKDRHVFTFQANTWDFPIFLNKSRLVKEKEKYLLDDVLTLKCDLSFSIGETKSKIIGAPMWVVKHSNPTDYKFREEVEDLHCTMRFSDVQLRASDDGDDIGPLSAHRFILEARSKTFADLLSAQEDTDDVLVVPDLNTRTLERLIKYIYTDEVEDLRLEMELVELGLKGISALDLEAAIELYRAGFKYQVQTLQCRYSFFFQSQLNVDNVCGFLVLADECDDMHLKNSAVEFITRYMNQVTETDAWKRLDREKKLLVQQTKEKASQAFTLKHCLRQP